MRRRSPLRLTLPSSTYRTPSSRPTCRISTALPLYWKLEVARDDQELGEPRQLGDDVLGNAVAEIVLLRVATEIGERKDRDRRLVRERQFRLWLLRRRVPRAQRSAVSDLASSRTAPTKRRPLRASVLIRRCSAPLSPIAHRAALIRVVSVDSETMRPPQIAATRSSLLATRSRFLIKIGQQVEHLRLDRDRNGAMTQLAPIGVESVIFE